MSWFTDRHCFLVAVFFYGISVIYSSFLWRQGFKRDNRINYSLLLAGFVFHTLAMFKRGFSIDRCPINNLYEAATFIAWTMVATYLVLGLWHRLRFLGAFASPILFSVGVFALMPALDTQGPKPEFAHGWASFHAALILLAYGAFGLSSVASLMFLTQEHDLKFHKLRAITSLLPPVQRMEWTISRLLTGGFALLTIGLISGSMGLKQEAGAYSFTDPTVIWSFLAWLVYLALLVLYWRFSQRGRRFAWGVIGGFVFILITFLGLTLYSSIHNP